MIIDFDYKSIGIENSNMVYSVMRKIFALVLMSVLINSKVFADVYYCIDKSANGYYSENNRYETTTFVADKFTMELDLDKLTISSGFLRFQGIGKCTKDISIISCANSHGDIITMHGSKRTENKLGYVRARTYGPATDSIYVAHGECEIF